MGILAPRRCVLGPSPGFNPRGTVITNPSRCPCGSNGCGHSHYRLSSPRPLRFGSLVLPLTIGRRPKNPPSALICSTLGNGDHPLALPPCAMLVMSSSLHAGEWSVVSTSPSYSGLKPDFLVCLHPGYPLIIRLRSGIQLLGGSGPTFALPCTIGNVLRPDSNPRPSD